MPNIIEGLGLKASPRTPMRFDVVGFTPHRSLEAAGDIMPEILVVGWLAANEELARSPDTIEHTGRHHRAFTHE
ncbi:uncharacterized protein ANIA_11349 [Aspergillus nidulans FGSC A4]|uniref:Uncharacterized protein n=1 Tax=Emericella nidulans (strain FGSC A4 / ATCC 38163 / CBS 112.46 / NRRL 194 / M139) TaxID=227321 RepID=C8VPW1_EMENI|nr:hypothetical protein [Aspergillus nidulans FGSC A4]CBF87125.1 TPA: hypothetical protein ANIA_11349 [Aspergillus nidulans FGSC A4]